MRTDPRFMLAREWNRAKTNIVGWYVSEKLNGMRAWIQDRHVVSRYGNEIFVPSWWTETLPLGTYDVELYSGDMPREDLFSILRRKDRSGDWSNVWACCWETPNDRRPPWIKYSGAWCPKQGMLVPLIQTVIRSEKHLEEMISEYTDGGAEGLMVRHPDKLYAPGRSDYLLKIKFVTECQCRIVDFNPGEGKYKGMIGSLVVEEEDGTRCNVSGMRDELRKYGSWPLGGIVTVEYRGRSKYGIMQEARLVEEY